MLFYFFYVLLAVPYQYVRWLRDDVPIVDSRYPDIAPPLRVTLFQNGSLQVRDVKRNDTAEYLCEVMTTTFALETQLHAIEVQCKFMKYAQIYNTCNVIFWVCEKSKLIDACIF